MKILLASIAANIIEKALPLFPKNPKDCKIICIPTAAKVEDGPKDWLDNELNQFRKVGFNLTMFDIDRASEEDVSRALEDADIIYVTGGNTFFLLEKMKACLFERYVRKALERGAVYIGSSAGSIVCCPEIDFVKTMDDRSKAYLEDTEGLNLIDFLIMVHMDHSSFAEEANEKVSEMKLGPIPVICLKDHQAIFVDGLSISLI